MFDLIVTGHRKTTRGDAVPLAISTAVHAIAIGGLVVLPLMYATDTIPDVPSMMAFVTAAPAPPPPPPPPPAPAAAKAAAPRAVPTAGRFAAPLEAPTDIAPEPAVAGGADGGVPGGVEGGVPGGVLGGVVGGLPSEIPPPPPPLPPPPAPRAPVRTGGELQPPALVTRVPPVYPDLAKAAQIEGIVILEAIVGTDGHVEDVRVLRSVALLDKAAIESVRQWVYAPLLLNGKAERFMLTVTVSFKLTRS